MYYGTFKNNKKLNKEDYVKLQKRWKRKIP